MNKNRDCRLLAITNDSVTAGLMVALLEDAGIRVLGGQSFSELNAASGGLTYRIEVVEADFDRARGRLTGTGLEKWIVS